MVAHAAVEIIHLIDHVLAHPVAKEITFLLVSDFKNLTRHLKAPDHFLIRQSSSLHRHHLVKGRESVMVQIGSAGIVHVLGCGRTGLGGGIGVDNLGLIGRADFLRLGADDISARRPERASQK